MLAFIQPTTVDKEPEFITQPQLSERANLIIKGTKKELTSSNYGE